MKNSTDKTEIPDTTIPYVMNVKVNGDLDRSFEDTRDKKTRELESRIEHLENKVLQILTSSQMGG